MNPTPQWLDWISRLQAIAQNGLTFAHDPYDVERYRELRHIAAEMLAAGSDTDIATIHNLLAADSGYATPKTDVRGIVFRDDKILLVREKADGLWTAPGGWADVAASPAENVVREVREEAGVEVAPKKILALFDRSLHPHTPAFPYHVYKIFIRCEPVSLVSGLAPNAAAPSASASAADRPTPPSAHEIEAVDYFPESNLPPLSLTRVTPAQIHRMFDHLRNPNLPTDFDPL